MLPLHRSISYTSKILKPIYSPFSAYSLTLLDSLGKPQLQGMNISRRPGGIGKDPYPIQRHDKSPPDPCDDPGTPQEEASQRMSPVELLQIQRGHTASLSISHQRKQFPQGDHRIVPGSSEPLRRPYEGCGRSWGVKIQPSGGQMVRRSIFIPQFQELWQLF